MPEIFIDNKRYEFEGTPKVLQFVLDQGLELPFFCYHPALSIPANCRQCFVEAGTPVFNRDTNSYDLDENGERVIRWFPKLMTSCSLEATDGMVVKTHITSDKVIRGQKDTLEFILMNHPLDCPICDQAGECPLQIQTYKYGPEGSRFEHKKVHKPKRVQLGPNVVLDAERCINCTRCVRFTDEISKSKQLTIISRGDKNYPETAPGAEFDDPYSMNTIDICPVGALTSADFRFKARVWEMNQTPGIDMTGSKGTNIDLWTRNNLIMRITPRYNPEVNDYWMPDEGRMDYKRMNENRISRPAVRMGENHVKSSWKNAVLTLPEQMQKVKPSEILVIGSGHASVEDNFVMSKFFNLIGVSDVHFTPHIEKGKGDSFLITDDLAPNSKGCRYLGFKEQDSSQLAKSVKSENIKLVVILGDDLLGRGVLRAGDLADKVTVFLGTNNCETSTSADLVIPVTCSAEHAASYVNENGYIQRTFPAKETMYTDRRLNLEMSMGRLDHYGTKFDNWISDDNRIDCIPAWEYFVRVAEAMDVDMSYQSSREIMDEIAETVEIFSGVSYERMDDDLGIDLNQEHKPQEEKTVQ
jgi:NADH-quinone oxidoreductase subunit G